MRTMKPNLVQHSRTNTTHHPSNFFLPLILISIGYHGNSVDVHLLFGPTQTINENLLNGPPINSTSNRWAIGILSLTMYFPIFPNYSLSGSHQIRWQSSSSRILWLTILHSPLFISQLRLVTMEIQHMSTKLLDWPKQPKKILWKCNERVENKRYERLVQCIQWSNNKEF